MHAFLQTKKNEYLNYLSKIRSENSYKTYKSVLDHAIEHFHIEKGLIDITPYRIVISSQSKKTIAKKVSIIRNFVEFIDENGGNFRLRGDESVKTPQTLPKPVNTEHLKEALKSADLFDYTLLFIMYGLGLRMSEVSGIKLSDIKEEWIEVHGKGEKSRYLPLFPELKTQIERFLKIYPSSHYLFEKEGVVMNPNRLRYRIDKVFKKIGVKVTPHQLRHFFATDLLNNGARINDVSELLGHSSLSTTQIYTKLNSKTKMENYQKAHPLCEN